MINSQIVEPVTRLKRLLYMLKELRRFIRGEACRYEIAVDMLAAMA